MEPTHKPPAQVIVLVIVIAAILGALWYYFARTPVSEAVVPTPTDEGTAIPSDGTIELGLGQSGKVGIVTITPKEILEDSRCPSDVQCIQAGRVRLLVTLAADLTSEETFIVGEPVMFKGQKITLLEVKPVKMSKVTIATTDYRFVFKLETPKVTYVNASADMITVSQPGPGDVTGKTFKIIGKARGSWFFEASFPIQVLGKDGKPLATVVARAGSDWMTTDFVPFTADVVIPQTYIGPVTLVLRKDNPSGLPKLDASLSYPITVEY